MEARKNPEADIERRKGSFMLLGLLTAVAITLVALEWTVFDKTDSEMATLDLEFLEEEVIPPSARAPCSFLIALSRPAVNASASSQETSRQGWSIDSRIIGDVMRSLWLA